MRVEVGSDVFELNWREAAALLMLYLVKWHAATLSDLELVTGNYLYAVRTSRKLVELGLAREYKLRSVKLYSLTELGMKTAEAIKQRAEEVGVWKLAEKKLKEAIAWKG